MTPTQDRWNRISELFEAAAARSRDERAAFLDDACGADADLRAEIESLLEHDRRADGGFLRPPEGPVRVAEDPADPLSLIGRSVGAFAVERLIAGGGMGVVYLARQSNPDREVALKVMRPGVTSRAALRRFEYESQILARLRHPNIAQVHTAGTYVPPDDRSHDKSVQSHDRERVVAGVDDHRDKRATSANAPLPHGRGSEKNHQLRAPSQPALPYFAMEYIPAAAPITDYADARGLSVRERLELFAQVCDAVHHGHTKSVIHRDLKPANILVSSSGDSSHERFDQSRACKQAVTNADDHQNKRAPTQKQPLPDGRGSVQNAPLAHTRGSDHDEPPTPKIIDFGIARITDADLAVTTQTDAGSLIGTIQYTSPEQCDAASNDIDTRSDVYSLGVVLYELLCGRLPYDLTKSTVVAAARRICEWPPDPPTMAVTDARLARQLRGDLECILLKSLEKDREKRYQSAADLSRDLRRYLAGEPTDARPPTVLNRVFRWIARHPKISTLVACLSIATIVLGSAFGSIWWYANARPHEMWRSDDGKEARLLSASGRVLGRWTSEADDGIKSVDLLQRPGGSPLVLVGYSQYAGNPFPGELCAFDAQGEHVKPLWHRGVRDKQILPELVERDRRQDVFGVKRLWVYDIFPAEQSLGDEIIVSFVAGSWSQQTVHIYDLSGNLLYAIWQDGGVEDAHWMSDAGLLVFAGLDETVKMAAWNKSGSKEFPLAPIVFAVRPKLGHLGKRFLTRAPGDDPDSPVWYKYIHPLNENSIHYGFELRPPTFRHSPGRFVRLCLFFDRVPRAGVSWVVDEYGRRAHGTFEPGDAHVQDQKSLTPQLPPPTNIFLSDKPPGTLTP